MGKTHEKQRPDDLDMTMKNRNKYKRVRPVLIVLAIIGVCNLLWYLLYSKNIGGFRNGTNNVNEFKSRYPKPILTSIEKSIFTTDERLRLLAQNYIDHEFIHPNANWSTGKVAVGVKMNSVREMAQVTEVSIDIEKPCGGLQGKGMTVVVFLFCVVDDVQRRKVIRETFGGSLKKNNKTEIYFVVANNRNNDPKLEMILKNESKEHNDILQFNFLDDYYNLTLKSIATIRWSALRCPHAKFIFKLDNDCYIRTNKLLEELKYSSSDTIYGLLRMKEPVIRQRGIKWYIDPLYFPNDFYLPYIAGPYLIGGSVTAKLYEAVVSEPTTDTIPALPFDDAYTTGILADKMNIQRYHFSIGQLWSSDKENMNILRKHSVFYETLEDADLIRLWSTFGEN